MDSKVPAGDTQKSDLSKLDLKQKGTKWDYSSLIRTKRF